MTEAWPSGGLQQADELAAGPLPDDAVRPYRELLELEPEHVEGRLHFARLLDRLEEATDAVEVLSEGCAGRPIRPSFWCCRGALFGSACSATGRQRWISGGCSGFILPMPRPSSSSGLLLWRRGLVQEAAASFHRALEFQPDNAKTYYYLGDALNQLGDLAGARAALERALQVSPSDAKAYHLMGRVLDRLNLPEQAQEMYRRCRDLTGL